MASKTSAPPIKTSYGFELPASSRHAWLHVLVSQIEDRMPGDQWVSFKPNRNKQANAILAADPALGAAAAASLLERLHTLRRFEKKLQQQLQQQNPRDYIYNDPQLRGLQNYSSAISTLLEKLMARSAGWTVKSAEAFVAVILSETEHYSYSRHKRALLPLCEKIARREELSPALRDWLRAIKPKPDAYGLNKAQRKTIARIDLLVGKAPVLDWDPHDPWAAAIIQGLQRKPIAVQGTWNNLVQHAAQISSAKPGKQWVSEARQLLDRTNSGEFRDGIARWFPSVTPPPVKRRRGILNRNDQPIRDRNAAILRGLVWMCGLRDDEALATPIGDLALVCLKKYPGYTSFCGSVGNACVEVLSAMSGDAPVIQLSRLKARL